MSHRIGLVVSALAILVIGLWLALRESTPSRSAVFGYAPLGSGGLPLYDQLPFRIGIAVVASSAATALIMIAMRRRG
jgi:hypothetical protein